MMETRRPTYRELKAQYDRERASYLALSKTGEIDSQECNDFEDYFAKFCARLSLAEVVDRQ